MLPPERTQQPVDGRLTNIIHLIFECSSRDILVMYPLWNTSDTALAYDNEQSI